ncbi:GYD domain-containing protein [Micromonospora thermarum]|uniref:GYD domain-containing protein n=1 Tax=Micromonospora thermarum TaxID=2720024 RepID=A0ABX0Z725_9ACTN|nr:GYD domain-containing protein [Micromonospora thermarum]NJP32056.1 GYD domain-containing protein [Micromonospora thermarum]
MAKFLVKATYTAQGIAGLGKEGGTARAEVVRALIENSGGRVETLYFAFGEYDLYVVGDLPDTVTAAALGIAVRAAGGVDARVVPLITPEEIDAAAQLPVMYQPPGR